MASKEVRPHSSFSFDFTIASWQLTWPRCHQFEAQVDCSWVLVCWMLFRWWFLRWWSPFSWVSLERCLGELETQFCAPRNTAFQFFATPPTLRLLTIKWSLQQWSIRLCLASANLSPKAAFKIFDYNHLSSFKYTFRIGDPVWAKMKGFSPWPGKVIL